MIIVRFSLAATAFSRPSGPASEGSPAARWSTASLSESPSVVSLILFEAGPCATEKFSGRFAASRTSA